MCKMLANIKDLLLFCKNFTDFSCNMINNMYICSAKSDKYRHKLKYGTNH